MGSAEGSAATGKPRRQTSKKRQGTTSFLKETAIIVVSALVLSWIIKTFLMQAFYIPSGSMEDTLEVGDRILVNKLVPAPVDLHRGDVVVFVDPGGWIGGKPTKPANPITDAVQGALTFVGLLPQDAGSHLIKRVIGLPGDHVECCTADGLLTVNGEPITEPYLMPGDVPSQVPFDVVVPEGSVWVMGDHRSDSSDSRYHQESDLHGAIPIDNIVGRTFLIVWPFADAGSLPDGRTPFDNVPDP